MHAGVGLGGDLERRGAARARRVGRVEQRLELEALSTTHAREGARRLQREASIAPHALETDVAVRADADQRTDRVRAVRTRRRRLERRRDGARAPIGAGRPRERVGTGRDRCPRELDAAAARARHRRAGEGRRELATAARAGHEPSVRRRRRLRTNGVKPPIVTAKTRLSAKIAMSQAPLASLCDERRRIVCARRFAMLSAP